MPNDLFLLFTERPKNAIIYLYEGCFIRTSPDFRALVRVMSNRRLL